MKEEEKKKRWRPSLTAYRELEDTDHQQCIEIRGWRETYHDLRKDHDRLQREFKDGKVVAESDFSKVVDEYNLLQKKMSLIDDADRLVKKELDGLKARNSQLERSNRMADECQKRQTAEVERLKKALDDANAECDYLRNRGLWARIMNY